MQKFLSTNSILSCLAAISCSALHVDMVGLHTTYHFNEKRGRERVEGEDEWEREEKGRREGGREGKRKESVLLSEVFCYRGVQVNTTMSLPYPLLPLLRPSGE